MSGRAGPQLARTHTARAASGPRPPSWYHDHLAQCCRRPRFTLHGLWPNYSNGYPSYCGPNGTQLNVTQLQPVLPLLNKWWPTSQASPSNADFWSHEYIKHGTCAARYLPTELLFFSAALRLQSSIPLYRALSSAKLIGTASPVQTAKVKSAIQAAFGQDVLLDCDGQGRLAEVYSCWSPELEPLSCASVAGGSSNDGCNGTLTIPPFPTSNGA